MSAFLSWSSVRELLPPRTSHWTPESMPDLTGRVYLVTGGNSGIGRETVKALLKKNGKVYMAARSKTKAEEAIAALRNETGRSAIFLQLDLADLASVRRSADEFLSLEPQLNTLFNSGGVMHCPLDHLTADGYDQQFGTNVVGHFFLTKLLLPALLRADDPRVIITSSASYKEFPKIDYDTLRDGPRRRKLTTNALYGQSKLGNIFMANELARRYGDKLVAISLHPGIFPTELQRHAPLPSSGIGGYVFSNWILRPLDMGAITQLWAGTMPEAKKLNGKYLIPWATEGQLAKQARDVKAAAKLWDYLEEQVSKY